MAGEEAFQWVEQPLLRQKMAAKMLRSRLVFELDASPIAGKHLSQDNAVP
jgi:hypothetical protein